MIRARAMIRTLLLLAAFWPALGYALETAPTVTKRTTASLVSEADSVGPDGRIRLALRLIQAPGWHTYWRNPGDAGLQATLAFTLPPGASASEIAWPTPQREAEGPITTFAYTGEVLLPVTVHAPPGGALPGGALPVTLQANWLVCANVCVPEEAQFTLSIPAGAGAASAQAALFAAADLRTPRASPWTARIDPAGVLRVTGADLGPTTVREAWFAPYEPGRFDISGAQDLRLRDGALSLTLTGVKAGSGPLAGVLVLRDAGGRQSAFEIAADPGPAVADDAAPPSAGLGVLLAALLGGLLLNVMPCVFPVLAMKAAGLAGLAAGERPRSRRLALSYLLGSVATFTGMGALLLGLRRAGELAGWGFQFQSPAFVAGMALVLFVLGLNLSGVFSVELGRLAGGGQRLAGRGGHVGSFATGALAVLVATPCTAPFMGAAITAALAAPGPLAVGVFVALGVGLALPYVALAWAPGFGRMLPRPGAWMDRLRQGLAFPMYLTVAWLAWVLAQQTGPDGVGLLAVGCTILAFCCWVLGGVQRNAGRRLAVRGLLVVVALAVFGSLAALRPAPAAPAADAFSPARLADLRAAGRPVFVDMTAAWCVTCLVNERVALAPGAVRAAFAERGVVLLRGDWTSRDAQISRFLREHGSDGVPLYVFYPGGGGDPVVLPQILTPGMVLAAIAA